MCNNCKKELKKIIQELETNNDYDYWNVLDDLKTMLNKEEK